MESIVLKHGMIYDGTGERPFYGDVWIAGDRIKKVGECLDAEEVSRVIELNGLAVTPGFIDMHRHCDKSPLEVLKRQRTDDKDLQQNAGNDYGTVLLRQVINTVVTGHCGISMYPLTNNQEKLRKMWDY